jgi:hypothetical protein
MVVETLKQNLYWLVPIVLPPGFLLANVLMKLLMGQRQIHFLGADLTLCGCSLFSAIALRQILSRAVTEPSEIALAIFLIFVFLFLWAICLFLGRPQKFWISVCAICLGAALFYLSAILAWRMLSFGR